MRFKVSRSLISLFLRGFVFLGVFAISFVCLGFRLFRIDYYLFYQYDADAFVTVWLDENENDLKEPEEAPMEGVCVWAGHLSTPSDTYQYPDVFSNWDEICSMEVYKTREDGHWNYFFPGSNCGEIHILINPPAGYRLTGKSAVNGCNAEFGLVQKDSASTQIISAETYLKRQLAFDKFKRVAIICISFGLALISAVLTRRSRRKIELEGNFPSR